jgi:hypothetical protein
MSKNIIIFFSLISINRLANPPPPPFKVMLGLSKPPYFIEENH